MKIQELRDLSKNADRAQLEKAFTETYKLLPKAMKEEIDDYLTAILTGNDKSVRKAKSSSVSFNELKADIETFLKNVYASNYIAPNRVVPKNQRSKWRFQVKNFLKDLETIDVTSPNYNDSVILLQKLYVMLCDGCAVYLFSTDDPFRSVGIEQHDLFKQLVTRTFASGYDHDKAAELMNISIYYGLSSECVNDHLESIFVNALESDESKKEMLDEIIVQIDNKHQLATETNNYTAFYRYSHDVDELANIYLMIEIQLSNPIDGVKFMLENSHNGESEIALYCALRTIRWYAQDKELWIQAYEYGLSQKIDPRDILKNQYQQLKNNEADLDK